MRGLNKLMMDSTTSVFRVNYSIYYLCFECKYVISIITKIRFKIQFLSLCFFFHLEGQQSIREVGKRDVRGLIPNAKCHDCLCLYFMLVQYT